MEDTILINYVYLSDNEALQLKDYIEKHSGKHLVIRTLTGKRFLDSGIHSHTFVGINDDYYPGWNPNNPEPIENQELIDPNCYLYL